MPELPLVFPQLAHLYQTLAPVAEALLRVWVGLALVPHGLRNTFNFFPTTGQPLRSLRAMADYMDKQAYRPGWFWAPAVSLTQLVCGPLLALGRYFWNQLGLEYTLMWTIAALYFLVHGGGVYSLDRLLIGREF
jgi:putative oxidoreductase